MSPHPASPSAQSAALRGATLAFNGKAPKPTLPPSTANAQRARGAAILADTVSKLDSGGEDATTYRRELSPDRHPGTVKEKIRQFSENVSPVPQAVPGRVATTAQSRSQNHQQIAAQLAVGRSPVRTSPAALPKPAGLRQPSFVRGESPIKSGELGDTTFASLNPKQSKVKVQEHGDIPTSGDTSDFSRRSMSSSRHLSPNRGN